MTRNHSHDEPNSPEVDAALAQEILAEGDLPHAMFHVASALAGEPTNQHWLTLFEEIAREAPDPVQLVVDPSDQKSWFGLVAAKARLLHRAGSVQDAMDLLMQVIASFPARGYHAWAIEWAKDPACQRDKRGLFTLLTALMQIGPIGGLAEAQDRKTIEALLPLLSVLCRQHADDAIVQAWWGTVLCKCGHLDEAIQVVESAYRQGPCWQTAMHAANAFKLKGDRAKARWYFEASLRHDPADLSSRLDLGDMCCDEGQLEEGLKFYESVLAMEENHPWARPSAAFLRWRLTGNDHWLTLLRNLRDMGGPAGERAADLLTEIHSQGEKLRAVEILRTETPQSKKGCLGVFLFGL